MKMPAKQAVAKFRELLRLWRPMAIHALRDYAMRKGKTLIISKSVDQLYASLGLIQQDEAQIKSMLMDKAQGSLYNDVDQLRQSFKMPFGDPWLGFQRFVAYIQKCAAGWSDQKYFAPYIALVQSSGTGKSRYVYEYGKQGWLIYVCLRDEMSSGFPLRTPILADILENPDKLHGFLRDRMSFKIWLDICPQMGNNIGLILSILFFAASIRVLRVDIEEELASERKKPNTEQRSPSEFGENHREKWRRMQLDETSVFGEKVLDQMAGLICGSLDAGNLNWLDILGATAKQLRIQMCLLRTLLLDNNLADAKSPPVLFAFDEASTLLSHDKGTHTNLSIRPAFHSLRYALNCFLSGHKKEVNFFAVVLDTMGRLSNYVPSKMNDPSLRFIKSTDLYEPFFDIDNWNINAALLGSKFDMDMDESMSFALRIGRPLWCSLRLPEQDVSSQLQHIITIAQFKLICTEPSQIGPTCTSDQGLAVLAARFGIQIAPYAPVAAELTRSHLALCYYASSKDEITSIGYPAETMVGIAASCLIRNHLAFSLDKLLAHFDKAMKFGIVSKGDIGELNAQIILAEAFDRACSADNTVIDHITGITLETFLKTLLNDACYELMVQNCDAAIWGPMKSGRVRMSQFIRANYTPSLNDLVDWYNRGVVCIGKYLQPGWDILIPVKMETGMTAWVVSVKNLKSISKHSENVAIKSSLFTSRVVTDVQEIPITIHKSQVKPHVHSQSTHDPRTPSADTPETPEVPTSETGSDPKVGVKVLRELVGLPYGVLMMNLTTDVTNTANFQVCMGHTATTVIEKYALELSSKRQNQLASQISNAEQNNTRMPFFAHKCDGDVLVVHPSEKQVVVGIEGLEDVYRTPSQIIQIIKQLNKSCQTRVQAENINFITADSIACDSASRRKFLESFD